MSIDLGNTTAQQTKSLFKNENNLIELKKVMIIEKIKYWKLHPGLHRYLSFDISTCHMPVNPDDKFFDEIEKILISQGYYCQRSPLRNDPYRSFYISFTPFRFNFSDLNQKN